MSGGWGWGSLFGGGGGGGGGGKGSKDTIKNAILKLRSQQEMLEKRERHLQNQMAEQDNIARKNVSTNKTLAKAALRRKKNYEHSLEQTQAQQMTVEREISSIESANINKETLDAMKGAQEAIKKIHGGLTIDKVDETMQALQEQHMIGEEIAEALTSGSLATGVDDEELDEELADLEQEQLDNKMLKTGSVPVADRVGRLPDAAQGEPTRPNEVDEDEEFEQLKAEMAM